MEDHEIVALYWARNDGAIAESDRKYGRYCRTVAKNIVAAAEDAEECVSDTWFRAWNTMPPHRPSVLRTFFAKLTRRSAFDKCRSDTAQKRGGKEYTAALEELAGCLAAEADPLDEVMARELAQTVRAFLRELPEREANIFLRRYFFAEAVSAIARRYGLTPGNTAVILSRTRQKLKTRLIQEGYFYGQT